MIVFLIKAYFCAGFLWAVWFTVGWVMKSMDDWAKDHNYIFTPAIVIIMVFAVNLIFWPFALKKNLYFLKSGR